MFLTLCWCEGAADAAVTPLKRSDAQTSRHSTCDFCITILTCQAARRRDATVSRCFLHEPVGRYPMGAARHLSDIQPEKMSAGRGLTEEIRLFLTDVESPRRNEMFEGFFGLAEVQLNQQRRSCCFSWRPSSGETLVLLCKSRPCVRETLNVFP